MPILLVIVFKDEQALGSLPSGNWGEVLHRTEVAARLPGLDLGVSFVPSVLVS